MKIISILLVIFFISTSTSHTEASEATTCNTLGLHVVDYADGAIEGVWVDEVTAKCLADSMGIRKFDIIIEANGERITSENEFYNSLRNSTYGDDLEIVLVRQGTKHTVYHKQTITLDEYANTYQEVNQTGNHFGFWFKRILIFSIAFILIPIGIAFMRNPASLAVLFGAGAIYGAINAKGNRIQGAIQGTQLAVIILVFITFIGPIGLFYSFHRIVFAYSSDADHTWCCLSAYPMIDYVGKVDISGDGKWLVNAVETPNKYLGLGDRLLEEKHMLSIMDLDTGKFVKWADTNSMWFGFDVRPKTVLIEDAIFIEKEFAYDDNLWRVVQMDNNFLESDNFKRGDDLQVSFQSVGMSEGVFEFRHTLTGEIKEVITNQIESSSQRTRLSLTSYDGRVLATARAYYDYKETDGFVTELLKMIANWLIQPWEIQFWNVEDGSLIATYKGHGIDNDSISHESTNGSNLFLDSSMDGRRWYMTKNDGYVHVFDLSAKIPAARMKASDLLSQGIIDSKPAISLQVVQNSSFNNGLTLQDLDKLHGMSSRELLFNQELRSYVTSFFGDSVLEMAASMEYPSSIIETDDKGYIFTFCRIPNCARNGLVLYMQINGLIEAFIYDTERTDTQMEGNRYMLLSNSPFTKAINLPLKNYVLNKFRIDIEKLYQNNLLSLSGSMKRLQI